MADILLYAFQLGASAVDLVRKGPPPISGGVEFPILTNVESPDAISSYYSKLKSTDGAILGRIPPYKGDQESYGGIFETGILPEAYSRYLRKLIYY